MSTEIAMLCVISFKLQVKPRLFWYRHHPNMPEMVSDRNSRAENLTDIRKPSMRIFSIRKNMEHLEYCRKHKILFFVKTRIERQHGPYQSCTTQKKYILIKFNQSDNLQ